MVGDPPHRSVLLEEVIASLRVAPTGVYLDATVGAGGHAAAICERLTTGTLIGIDRDPSALAIAARRLERWRSNVHLAHARFDELASVLDGLGVARVDGVLADLGVSSMQLDDAARGFSFASDEAVDMRMDPIRDESAADWLRTVREDELARVLWEYGEERRSRRIAKAVVEARRTGETFTGRSLAELIRRCVPRREWGRIDPATRSFQAIRIAVNDELGQVERFLPAALARCQAGARIAVIAFHSLEDRIVKNRFRDWSKTADGPARVRLVTRKPVFAGEAETDANPRSRSARLRVAEVLGDEE